MSQTLSIIATGRRKSAVAQVKLILAPNNDGQFIINGKKSVDYMQKHDFLLFALQTPLNTTKLANKYNIFVKVEGGGLTGQAKAIQLGIARALCKTENNSSYRPSLKKQGYLSRDSRNKERKKYGLKKARKAPQFSKR